MDTFDAAVERSASGRGVMRTIRRLLAASLFIVCSSILSFAQEMPFNLGSGRVGEPYQQSIERVLADKYGMRLETGASGAVFEWIPVEGLPPGLKLNGDGTITGVPQSHQAQPYRFKVKVVDRSASAAEALELNFSIELAAPRIRLVKNNAPRLVPVYSAPEQASLPAGSTSVASGQGEANGDSVATQAQSATNAPLERATRFASPAQVENGTQSTNASIMASINAVQATPTPTPQPIPLNPALDDVSKFISIREDTGDKDTDELHKGVLHNRVSFHNTRSFADRKSTIIVQLTENAPNGTAFIVSANLTGANPVDIDGLPENPTQSGPQVTAKINASSPASINLRKAKARPGDELTIMIRRVNGNTNEVDKTFTIELDDYGFGQGVSPSIFFLSRPGVSESDVPAGLQPGTLQTTDPVSAVPTTNIPNPVNYSPSPGLNYTFSFKPKPNQTSPGHRVLRLLEPGFGLNATLMDFNDQTLSFADLSQKLLTNQGSDVQLGVGGALSFLSNSVQLTYGSNLNAQTRRGYFAFGINFLKLLSLVQQ